MAIGTRYRQNTTKRVRAEIIEALAAQPFSDGRHQYTHLALMRRVENVAEWTARRGSSVQCARSEAIGRGREPRRPRSFPPGFRPLASGKTNDLQREPSPRDRESSEIEVAEMRGRPRRVYLSCPLSGPQRAAALPFASSFLFLTYSFLYIYFFFPLLPPDRPSPSRPR